MLGVFFYFLSKAHELLLNIGEMDIRPLFSSENSLLAFWFVEQVLTILRNIVFTNNIFFVVNRRNEVRQICCHLHERAWRP